MNDGQSGAASALADIMASYWRFHLDEHPAQALEIAPREGIDRYFKTSCEDYENRNRRRAAFKEQLSQIDPEQLDDADRVNYEVLSDELDSAMREFELRGHLRPLWFPAGPEIYLSFVIGKDNLHPGPGVDAYLERLASVPEYFDAVAGRLQAGIERGFRLPEALLKPMIDNAEAMLRDPDDTEAFWYKPLARLKSQPGVDVESATAAVRRVVVDRVLPGFKAHADLLRGVLAKHCRDSTSCLDDPDGRAYYEALVRRCTDSNVPADEIHEIGLSEVARINAAMEDIASRTDAHADAAEMRAHLGSSPEFVMPSKEALLSRLKVLAKDIDSMIPEWFGVTPRAPYGVKGVPEELSEQMPPAYAEPNPPDRSRSGSFWVTSLPERCPTYMHIPLTLHEAWPGHLMHIALLDENAELPDFRRYQYLRYESLLEGWALYCERLGDDFGLYSDPYDALGSLEMEMWRAVRLVVDTGLHLHGWARERAIAYMQDNLTLPAKVIAAEVDRYIGMPAQALSYKMGELKIKELRKNAESTLGARFSLRDFHDCVTTAGSVPMQVLENRVTNWVAGVRDANSGGAGSVA